MSTYAVTAERLQVMAHPDPEVNALELAKVGNYVAVVRKGQFHDGQWALYLPEQGIVPDALLEEMGLVGMLAGKQGNRVKAKRLRGVLSQGLVVVPDGVTQEELAASVGEDWAPRLGVVKWVPEVPASMSGELEPGPGFVGFDVENIKRYPDLLVPGEQVLATEKIHGTCTVALLDTGTDRLQVTSKGYASKGLGIVESEANVYWRAVRAHGLEEVMRRLAADLGAVRLCLYGETYGTGIQDLGYGARKGAPGYAAFDAHVVCEDGTARWLEATELRGLLTGVLPLVPLVYDGPYDYDVLEGLAEGTESVSGAGVNIREGVVVRAVPERTTSTGERAMAKFVSSAYLTRKGGTELE